MSKTATITPEEESKFWERLGGLIEGEESPVEETDSYICYQPKTGETCNKS